MIKDLVSIVTPCYNGEEFIARFLESVLRQTYPNMELIIINDGSTDRTEEIIRSYKRLFDDRGINIIYRYQQNAGQAAALNRGLKLFSGEYMTWVDSDDELMPEYVSAKVEYLKAHPQCAFCYGKILFADENEPDVIVEELSERKNKQQKSFIDCLTIYVKEICFTGYMVRSEKLDAVIANRDIYSGRGGQNAQLLLPLSWCYGEPDYVEMSVYKSYNREKSHSHSKNTIEKIIKQLYNYESILTETLKRIDDKDIQVYLDKIKKHYAKLRFGNSIGAKDAALIRKQYCELKRAGNATRQDYLLYVKYTNPVIRKVFCVK